MNNQNQSTFNPLENLRFLTGQVKVYPVFWKVGFKYFQYEN